MNEILILPVGQFIPMCALNRCHGDGNVRFRGNCYKLNKPGPCTYPELSYIVAVNQTTLQLDCIQEASPPLPALNDRFSEDDDATATPPTTEIPSPITNVCPVGNRRWILQTCPSVQQPTEFV